MDLIAPDPALAGLTRHWDYRAAAPSVRVRLRRGRERLSRRAAPASKVLVSPVGAGWWSLYFVFSPDGTLAPAHDFTLSRLAALGRVLVVCASPDPEQVPAMLRERADALIWKDLPGFDFSAYAVGLSTLADHVPGSDVLVLNDSVFGPLVDLKPWLAQANWDLTGFTATANVEEHVQSYAWVLRGVTPARVRALAPALSTRFAYDRFWGVVLNQETRLAATAARFMRVGAMLHAGPGTVDDPSLDLALPLVRAGFPFLKRSLLGKLSDRADRQEVLQALAAAGHPLPEG
jgi:hypothetical protein